MNCPYCGVRFSLDGVNAYHMPVNFGRGFPYPSKAEPGDKRFTISAHKCPECREQVMWLNELSDGEVGDPKIVHTELLYPKTRLIVLPDAVPESYASEFLEAANTLDISPKASAALSRRLLQRLIREQEGIKAKTLFSEIEQLLSASKLPTYLAQDLDSIRHVGNFAAHPLEDQVSGQIIEVEPGEAEWTLNVLEALLTFYFVDLEKSRSRRAALNEKLGKAGKDPMLG